ncbi:MAG: NADH-quinone oxidoreductase subunit N [Paracidovorax wautersii]|uniref:NADH-quinone oxidoreductase subunit N n=1 Tax=Paracidovorax wautersii TaxID=1177982 RepID=A0A7V8FQ64_9BURK|nr:MAG: NADH-quinone oxidoreductase subunit N [Paracidovorax wautersii]
MVDQLSWLAIYPDLILLVMACVVLLVDLVVTSRLRTPTYTLTLVTLAVVALLQAHYALSGDVIYGWGNMVVSDPMGNWLKCFAAIATGVALIYGRNYAAEREMLRGGELFTLALFALLGIFIMISANNLLLIYLGLEMLTLSSYALVALRRDAPLATEAAMKYFVLGALASGFLLYGLSMLYGSTGTLDLNEISAALNNAPGIPFVLVLGLVFIVAGLAFKLGVVPFHMWIPDVYQGAPTVVTLLVGSAPKLAAFAIAIRLLVEGLLPLAFDWQQMLVVMSVVSMLVGNLAAIVQTNLKRMLAFSAIAQMGFVLLGLLAGVAEGGHFNGQIAYSSAMFYVVTYVLSTLMAFGMMLTLTRAGFECENLSDLAGLNRNHAFYTGMIAVTMLSLAGLPPLVGFYAKLSVLQALVSTGSIAYIWLAVFAVVMSLIGAFFYLRVLKVMYFDEPVKDEPMRVDLPIHARVVLTVNGALLLILGLLPGGLMDLCAQAIESLLAK